MGPFTWVLCLKIGRSGIPECHLQAMQDLALHSVGRCERLEHEGLVQKTWGALAHLGRRLMRTYCMGCTLAQPSERTQDGSLPMLTHSAEDKGETTFMELIFHNWLQREDEVTKRS